MTKKMLIDASHQEETRVVVVDGTRVEELDFESANKRQIRGNVYLARVSRVEPSLQAAFVEYGGNRHGFIAFSEIHPDYYQIPHEDKAALIAAEEADTKEEDEAAETELAQKAATEISEKEDDLDAEDGDDDAGSEDVSDDEAADQDTDEDGGDDEDVADASEKEVEEEQAKMGGARRKRISRHRYKIQEVIKRGQILLIQAVREERGNKGAAMTTYLSLAGRYCVLMPNTPRGGGISRKIPYGADRKRLKKVMNELEVPQGMGVIVRTAGASRTKVEIKRDFDYLSRLWDTIRSTTLKSIAPTLIHEEANLVTRSLRDLYGKDIDSVLVQGDAAYRTAKDFIKMLMPSHAKNIQQYKDDIPLFLRYQVESQIEDCLEPSARLRSGGYLVIHPTEALVSIDVNSGRSTKERNVERTALKTNLEAVEEVARQMRLRDLAGLIVIDLIDMDERRNNRAVERKMREVLERDRARINMGRISQFGLMEISRQRRRRSLLEGSTTECRHCGGVGRKRSVESSALKALRAVEEEGARGKTNRLRLRVTPDVANYIFNEKRELLRAIEERTEMFAEIASDAELIRPAYEIERLERKSSGADPLEEIAREHRQAEKESRAEKKRQKSKAKKDAADEANEDERETIDRGDDEKPARRKRRRGRRGGRKKTEDGDALDVAGTAQSETTDMADGPDSAEDAPKKKSRSRKKAKAEDEPVAKSEDDLENAGSDDKDAKPKRKRRASAKKSAAPKSETSDAADKGDAAEDVKKSRRRATKKAQTDAAEIGEDVAADAPGKKPTRKKSAAKKSAADAADAEKKPAKKTAKKPAAKKTVKKGVAKKADTADAGAEQSVSEPVAKPKKTARKAKSKTDRDAATAEPTPASAEKPEPKDAKPAGPKRKGWWSRKK